MANLDSVLGLRSWIDAVSQMMIGNLRREEYGHYSGEEEIKKKGHTSSPFRCKFIRNFGVRQHLHGLKVAGNLLTFKQVTLA